MASCGIDEKFSIAAQDLLLDQNRLRDLPEQVGLQAQDLLKIKLGLRLRKPEDVEENAKVCSLPNLKSLSVSQNVLKGLPKAQQGDEVTLISELGCWKAFFGAISAGAGIQGVEKSERGLDTQMAGALFFNVLLVPIFNALLVQRACLEKHRASVSPV